MNQRTNISEDLFNKHQSLKYVILPAKCPEGFEYTLLHNKAYNYWRDFWSEIYNQAGSLSSFKKDDFFRQDFIPVIMHEDEIVAVHLYTFFNMKQQSATEHSYFNFFNHDYMNSLSSKGIDYTMSMEFLTVNPKWRKKEAQISIGELLLGLGLRLFLETNAKAAIAPARKDVKAHEMAYKFNFTCIIPDVICRNFSCDLVAAFKETITPHPDDYINNLINKLWIEKQDTTQTFKRDNEKLKEIA